MAAGGVAAPERGETAVPLAPGSPPERRVTPYGSDPATDEDRVSGEGMPTNGESGWTRRSALGFPCFAPWRRWQSAPSGCLHGDGRVGRRRCWCPLLVPDLETKLLPTIRSSVLVHPSKTAKEIGDGGGSGPRDAAL
uniref:Uncharacterized protein n=1 Tax=Oryza punctata TaxID=4537 RepID=A0A0E0JYW5_ORYPU